MMLLAINHFCNYIFREFYVFCCCCYHLAFCTFLIVSCDRFSLSFVYVAFSFQHCRKLSCLACINLCESSLASQRVSVSRVHLPVIGH